MELELENTNRYAKKWRNVNFKAMKSFTAFISKIWLVRNFLNLLIIGQADKAWTPHGFILCFLVVTSERYCACFTFFDKAIIPARDDPSYQPSVRLRPQIHCSNRLKFLCTISLFYPRSFNQWKFGCWRKVRNPIFDSTLQMNTLTGLN